MKKRVTKDNGSLSVSVLIVLLSFSILGTGIVFLLTTSTGIVVINREVFETRKALIERADFAMAYLLESASDGVDSAHDPVFSALSNFDDFSATLTDISSYLDLNWVRKSILEATDLLVSRASAAKLQQYREDTGLHLFSLAGFEQFFADGIELQDYFTLYGYFNINIADEFTLRKVYSSRTGDEVGAEIFHTKVHNYRLSTAEKDFLEPHELSAFLGMDFDLLFPIINAAPPLNINFTPDKIIHAVFSSCRIKEADAKANQILSAREAGPVTQDDIVSILGDSEEAARARQYFGSKTWFWRLDVSYGGSDLKRILAAIPIYGTRGRDLDGGGRVLYRLIEESFTK